MIRFHSTIKRLKTAAGFREWDHFYHQLVFDWAGHIAHGILRQRPSYHEGFTTSLMGLDSTYGCTKQGKPITRQEILSLEVGEAFVQIFQR